MLHQPPIPSISNAGSGSVVGPTFGASSRYITPEIESIVMTAFVRNNENVMFCATTARGCGASVASGSNIRVDTQYLNVTDLIRDVIAVGKFLSSNIEKIQQAFRRHESLFENKFVHGSIDINARLLGSVNAVIGVIAQARAGLRSWNADAQNLVAALLDKLTRYGATRDIIQQLSGSHIMYGGLPLDELTRANQHLRTTKSMLAQHKRLGALNASIGQSMAQLKSLVSSFEQGILRTNNKRIELHAVFEAIRALDGDSASPLKRVQKDLVRIVNNSSLRFDLKRTPTVDPLDPSQQRNFEAMLDEHSGGSESMMPRILALLQLAEDGVPRAIYTEATKRTYERIIESLRDLYASDRANQTEWLNERINAYAALVRQRTPRRVMVELSDEVARTATSNDPLELNRVYKRLAAVVAKLSQDDTDRMWCEVFEPMRDEVAGRLKRVEDAQRDAVAADAGRAEDAMARDAPMDTGEVNGPTQAEDTQMVVIDAVARGANP